jgi:predicted transposase YbfD/YdcC
LGPLHLVSAWAQANRLVLAQTAVDDKSNEITAIPELLRMLCLKGCIVTLDAMGCQKAIARQIRQQGADVVRPGQPGLGRVRTPLRRPVTTDVRTFISSLPPEARQQLHAVRSHWAIENAHHWVLDVAFGEDDSRIRTGYAAHNMAILKRIAHNLLRQDRTLKVGIANKRLAAGWDKNYLCQLIGLGPKPI